MSVVRCGLCGVEHEGDPRDIGYALPDEVFALDAGERERRARCTSDTCALDGERWFLRCVLELPTPSWPSADRGTDDVAIGLWVEVARADFDVVCRYAGADDNPARPSCRGTVVNAVAGVRDSLGLRVAVRATSEKKRPKLFVRDEDHRLFRLQRDGIGREEWSRLLAKTSNEWAVHRLAERSARYALDAHAEDANACNHCGGATRRLTGFMNFDGDACAVYFARITAKHEPKVVTMLLSVGEWWEDGDASTRRAFALEIVKDGSGVRDATRGTWTVPESFGRPLTREAALADPQIDDVFEMVDVAMTRDPEIARYLGK